MNLKELFKYLLVAVILLSGCAPKKEIRIVPLSPFNWDERLNGITTHSYFYTIENFSGSGKQKNAVDSFVLKNLPRQFLKENEQVRFVFYKYEKGRIDEKFVHQEQPKQQNIFMEANPEHLLVYLWDQGKFSNVAVYKKGKYSGIEKRNW